MTGVWVREEEGRWGGEGERGGTGKKLKRRVGRGA